MTVFLMCLLLGVHLFGNDSIADTIMSMDESIDERQAPAFQDFENKRYQDSMFALDDRSLFLPGNPKDLVRAIDYWLDNPQERECMEKAYVKAAKKYSLAISVGMFEEMLNEEIEEQKTKH